MIRLRKLLNTLFVTSEDIYLSLENNNVVAWREDTVVQRVPLLNLENVIYCGYKGASPGLLGACVENNIGFCFIKPNGSKFLARVSGLNNGNVLLHKRQFQISENEDLSCAIARNFIVGKIHNSRCVLMRQLRDHEHILDGEAFTEVIDELKRSVKRARDAASREELIGIEGHAAKLYFSLFDQMILRDKKHFKFTERVRRPPTDRVNALLSLSYSILAHECACAAESVGLDSYVGFLHEDRSGRLSLGLDLMEEVRSIFADRFVLSLINNRIITADMFVEQEGGAVHLNKDGRSNFFSKWKEKKMEVITHPYLGEKIYWGLIPYVQSLLLSRHLRGDLDGYPVFLVK